MMKKRITSAFTLIELLMVIAIIGVLAGILIPTVGAVRKQANKAASKAQLSNYVNAIQMFKGEYGFLPFVSGNADQTLDLSQVATSEEFIETLSGRDDEGDVVTTGGNRRGIAFHSFSESEFFQEDDGTISQNELADRFNNKNINILLDGDGNGRIQPTVDSGEPQAPAEPLRANVTAWVERDDLGNPGYGLWE